MDHIRLKTYTRIMRQENQAFYFSMMTLTRFLLSRHSHDPTYRHGGASEFRDLFPFLFHSPPLVHSSFFLPYPGSTTRPTLKYIRYNPRRDSMKARDGAMTGSQ